MTELEFDAVRVTAEAPTPAIALITERRVDSLDVCRQLAQRDVFYLEARFYAAEKREPEHSLIYGDKPVDYLACIYNSTSGVWAPHELRSRYLRGGWYLMDTPRTFCTCRDGTIGSEPGAGPLSFLGPGTCEVTRRCVTERGFVYKVAYGTRSAAVLVPFEPGLVRINRTYQESGMKPTYCSAADISKYRALRGEISTV